MGKILSLNNLKKTLRYLRKNGLAAALYAAAERTEQVRTSAYCFRQLSEEALRQQREARWSDPVTFSVLVPAYETKEEYLKILLTSLLEQTYPHWEVILADAGKTDGVRRIAASYQDERIRYVKLNENQGIAGNTNEALLLAKGDYITLLDHDDYLTPDALYEMAAAIDRGAKEGVKLQILYSDEDKCDSEGRCFYDPHIKPDFNLDLLLSNNYICHLLVMKRPLFSALKLRSEFDGAQDFDLVLRAVGKLWNANQGFSRNWEKQICHISKVLYHWRCHEASTALNPASKQYAYQAGRRAAASFCREMGWEVTVSDSRHLGFYRVDYIPDLLTVRQDVGALAGSFPPLHGRMKSGIYEEDASERFSGLKKGFSGYMQRASMQQDVPAADIRQLSVQPQWQNLLEQKLKQLRAGGDPVILSREFAAILHEKGFRIVWDPEWHPGQSGSGRG